MFVPRFLGDWVHKNLPRWLVATLDRLYAPYLSWMSVRVNRRLIKRLFPDGAIVVLAGPFHGMKYLATSSGSTLIPKIVGTYEEELHGVIEQFVNKNCRRLIDIGCAEGYYLIGLALRLPGLEAHGFDLDAEAREKCKALADLNGVSKRIHLEGRCSSAILNSLAGVGTSIICDCEGGELELLDPQMVPSLRNADILVELHDRLFPGTTETISQRFAPTHKIHLIHSCTRNHRQYPVIAGLNKSEQRLAVDELRGGEVTWAFMESLKAV